MQKCAQTTNGNVFISPFSIFNALALVAQAAGGETYQQLRTGLGTGSNKKCTAKQFKNYIDLLDEAIGSSQFSLANEIYVQLGCKLNQQYQKTVVNQFKSGIEELDFADADESAQVINEFVAKETHDKIPNLVTPDMLSADTRVFLANAIYFKGDWLHPFDVENTYQGEFTTLNKRTPVNFMNTMNRFKYAKIDDLDVTVVELPYANSNLSFVILLPNNKQSVDDLSQNLQTYTEADYLQIAQQMYEQEVNVTIPKFINQFSINLNQILIDVSTQFYLI